MQIVISTVFFSIFAQHILEDETSLIDFQAIVHGSNLHIVSNKGRYSKAIFKDKIDLLETVDPIVY